MNDSHEPNSIDDVPEKRKGKPSDTQSTIRFSAPQSEQRSDSKSPASDITAVNGAALDAPTPNGKAPLVDQAACPNCGTPSRTGASEVCHRCLLLAGLSMDDTVTSDDEESPDEPLRIGRLGDFDLLEEIARGGMGIVYKARQRSLNRIVAVKMILSNHLASDKDVKRFYAEAKAAAHLEHASVVPIYEFGQIDGQHYYVMPYVPGTNLSEYLSREDHSLREFATLMVKLARAVGYAHARGVVHRDLKPANVLLDEYGEPRITDFGLAKKTQENSELTNPGQLMGTPSYMSPEQAMGQEVNGSADVYSLGAICYAGLCGRPPFLGESPLDVLEQVRNADPVRPRTLNPRLPQDLETICLKSLEKSPQRRYQSAEELADEFERFLRGEPIHARPVTPLDRTMRWCRRNPAVSTLLTAIVVLSVSAFLAVLYFWLESKQALQTVTEKQRELEIAYVEVDDRRSEAETNLEHVNQSLYLTRVSLAYQKWEKNHIRQARMLLEQCPPELREWEWHYLYRVCHAEQVELGPVQASSTSVLFDRDNKWIAAGYDDGQIVIWNRDTQEKEHDFLAHANGVQALAIDDSGKVLISTGYNGQLSTWDIETGQPYNDPIQLESSGMIVRSVPGTTEVIALDLRRNLYRIDWESGKILNQRNQERYSRAIAIDSSGEHVVFHSGGVLYRLKISAKSWEEPEELFSVATVIYSIAISNDGKWIGVAGGSEEPAAMVFDAESGELKANLDGHRFHVHEIQFMQEENRVMTASRDKSARIWDFESGEELYRLRGHGDEVVDIEIDEEYRRIATCSFDGTIKLWDVDELDPHRTVFFGQRPSSIQVTRDQTRAYIGFLGGYIQIADLQTGEVLDKRFGFRFRLEDLILTKDETQVIFVDRRKAIRRRDVTDLTDQRIPVMHGVEAMCVVEAPEGNTVYFGTYQGELYRAFLLPAGEVGPIEPAPGQIELVHESELRFVSIAISPDGKYLCGLGQYGRLLIYDLELNKQVRMIDRIDDKMGETLAFHPKQPIVAAAGSSGVIRLWNVETGELVRELIGHSWQVSTLAFHPKGNRLASGGLDETIKLWDIESGMELISFEAHHRGVDDIIFGEHGYVLHSVGGDFNWRQFNGTPVPQDVATGKRESL